jgi:diketogulonate reductase-like aldo/keto reductase
MTNHDKIKTMASCTRVGLIWVAVLSTLSLVINNSMKQSQAISLEDPLLHNHKNADYSIEYNDRDNYAHDRISNIYSDEGADGRITRGGGERGLSVVAGFDSPYHQLSNGVKMPLLLYGTAWKEDKTESLTLMALHAGFRGIDTANQGRHYNEAGVGSALKEAIEAKVVERKDVFLQTKFTYPRGHLKGDEPYDIDARVADQVRQSFASSLRHLQTDYIDSYILHGPYKHGHTLSPFDFEVWDVLEELYNSGKVKAIGISNFSAKQLKALLDKVKIKPHVAQIRTFAASGWDERKGGVFRICKENDIVYEAYSLLTANRAALNDAVFLKIAKEHDETPQQLAFRFAFEEGMVVLTGTTDPKHMHQDLQIQDSMIRSHNNLNYKESDIIRNLKKL